MKILNKRIQPFESLLFRHLVPSTGKLKRMSSGPPHILRPKASLREEPHFISAATSNTKHKTSTVAPHHHRDGWDSDVHGEGSFVPCSSLRVSLNSKCVSIVILPSQKQLVRTSRGKLTPDSEPSQVGGYFGLDCVNDDGGLSFNFIFIYLSSVCVHVWWTNCSSWFSPSTV